MVAVRKGMRAAVLAVVLGSGLMLAACHDGRPGHASDRHHGGHHDHDRGHRY